ncbi:4-amino-4-deoxy-L-arabinose transferase [Aromatoleum tolulyticum]|uniref:4-amino-4-deoxy-L-arabinose transferase n=1 Tax=Aromatoleum tolulyticum TaxID=34027 RepID=A0A1N7C2H7_9RHOO|nr:4-amino-4-deoxy-L-arabinose transferase [Aromatoleum tolulyticum]
MITLRAAATCRRRGARAAPEPPALSDHAPCQGLPPRPIVTPDSRNLYGFYLLLGVVYLGGLCVPLMNNDSAHHATIALHMHLTGDYASLVTQGEPYLDKPHLLFWLAAGAYKLLGVTTLAFKLPSLLFSVLGVYATYGLGRVLYSREVGRVAALILASSLAFILANNDVRMDAVLTAAIALSIWQLAEFATYRRWRNLVLAALGLALGFATKGMIGVAMPAIAIFVHLLYRRDWRGLFDPRWLVLALLTLVLATPVLWAYHRQFGIDGVKFILWSQNFERLSGGRFGTAGGSDPLFFFHTFVWAFLPWSLLGAAAVWARGRELVAARLRPVPGQEMLTLGTIAVMFGIISSSGFKLPHYLNILLPLFAVLLASWLVPRMRAPAPRGAKLAQGLVWALMGVLALAFNAWAFPLDRVAVGAGAVALALAGVVLARPAQGMARLVFASVVVAAVFNFLQNFNFYPQLLRYQAGNNLALALQARGIDVGGVRHFGARANSFDFYTGQLAQPVTLDELKATRGAVLVYAGDAGRKAIEEAGLRVEELAASPEFRVTRLSIRFLDPRRREETLSRHYVLRVSGEDRQ